MQRIMATKRTGGAVPAPDTTCVADEECEAPSIPGCPVPLCVKHLGRVYTFANDHIEQARQAVSTRQRKIGAKTKAITTGSVYIIRFDSRIKIGFSTNVRQRMYNLHPDEVLAIVPGTMLDEQRVHRRFEALRITGEWFRSAPDLLQFATNLSALGSVAAAIAG
jgi:hypothetical protein